MQPRPGWGSTAFIDRKRLRSFEVFTSDLEKVPALSIGVPKRYVLVARLRTVYGSDGSTQAGVIVALEHKDGTAVNVWHVSESGEVAIYDDYGAPGVWRTERKDWEVSAA